MGWMDALAQTYDACFGNPDFINERIPLLPICHTMNLAQIEVTLDSDGRFCRAEALPKEKQNTIVPCTEQSGGRTSRLSAHPLADKLQYLAKDYLEHFPKDSGSKKVKSGFDAYSELLNSWCISNYSNSKIVAVKKYVESGTLIKDLILSGILVSGSDGRLLSKKEVKETVLQAPGFAEPKITGEQHEAFVRWRVDIPGDPEKDTWKDEKIHKDWIKYYISTKQTKQTLGFCYVSGRKEILAEMHPSRIRYPGDKAKIISSNDTKVFAFRGRFETAEQACGISFETTQKAHNALRWLIERQGLHIGELYIVSWVHSGKEVTNPIDDSSGLFIFEGMNDSYTGIEAAQHLNKRIYGYNSKILDEEVMIMEVEAATSGRLSILMYRECLGKDFVKRLEDWHWRCAWKHNYAYEEGGEKKISFIGAPSPKDIAKAAYGEKADLNVIAHTIKRILPCILDGMPLPKDIVDATVKRASNPGSMEKRRWEWLKTLSIACSVYKYWEGGKYEMVLEKERKTRDYLYGRLLAVADLLESSALSSAGEKERQTTAIRMMQRFSDFPFSTWRDIEVALVPYKVRLGPISKHYDRKIAEIMDLFDADDFINNSKLSGEFLLAYHCQKEDHFRRKEKSKEEKEE